MMLLLPWMEASGFQFPPLPADLSLRSSLLFRALQPIIWADFGGVPAGGGRENTTQGWILCYVDAHADFSSHSLHPQAPPKSALWGWKALKSRGE